MSAVIQRCVSIAVYFSFFSLLHQFVNLSVCNIQCVRYCDNAVVKLMAMLFAYHSASQIHSFV